MTEAPDARLRGIALMVASMAAFSVTDVLVKLAAGAMSPAHTTVFLVGGGLVVFATMAKAQGQVLWDRAAFSKVMILRYLSEIMGTFGIVMALSTVDLSTVGAIIQMTPLVVVAGAVLFLGEKVSWRRWAAIGVGVIGMLMIIQPGGASFEATVFWPVIAMLGLSGRDLTTRVTPPGMASSRLAAYTMAAALPVALIWALLAHGRVMPVEPDWPLILGMVLCGALGYLLLIGSIRMTEVSVVSPFRYSRLIFLLLAGVVFFDERPDALMLAGAALIIASGIYTMWRDAQVKRHLASVGAP